MAALIIAGEAVFSLPFHVTRYFRPTFLEVFGFTNSQLGQAQAVYGVVGMIAYFPGGPLADRFSARTLLVSSLLTTGLGGLYMATIPGVVEMSILWGVWGLTSILCFWAAMIKATREWGGADAQGRAFGILDGGRGAFSVVMAIAAAQIFKMLMPDNVELATLADKTVALENIIYSYTTATLLAAVFVWFAIPAGAPRGPAAQTQQSIWAGIPKVLKMPPIWLQSMVIVCAYVAYKGTDYYGLLARDVYGMNDVEAAWISTISAYTRPVACVLAGLLADKYLSSKVVSACFLILIASFLYMGLFPMQPDLVWLLTTEILIACIAVYGLRGVYFALFEEASLPVAITGTAAGIVSVIGYTPDIFVGPIAGWLLDTYPGAQGHQYFYLFLTGAAVMGLVASIGFTVVTRGQRGSTTTAS
jgi:sugar phosphate permease